MKTLKPSVLALLALALGGLLAGCATNAPTTYAASVMLMKDGFRFDPSKQAYAHAKGSLSALLAEQNLRLGETKPSPETPFVATVEVRATGTGDDFEPVKVLKVMKLFKTARAPASPEASYQDGLAPLRAQVEKGFRDALWDMPVK